MALSRAMSLTFGAIAVTSSVATLSFDLIFASNLSSHLSPNRTYITAIVSSTLECVTVILLLFLLYKQVVYRSGAYVQDSAARQHTYLLAGFGGIFGILSSIASAVLYGMLKSDMAIVPRVTLHTVTETMVTAAFSVWAFTLSSQALFVLSSIIMQRRIQQQQVQPYQGSEQQPFPEMKEGTRDAMAMNDAERGTGQSAVSHPSSDRSRSGSETRSFRSSFSQGVRPSNSRTKLIPATLMMSPNRSLSMESSLQDSRVSGEDGFDSWDFSSIDPHSRKTVETSSPGLPRGLPTIPASPTGSRSRSPSPGFAFDLEPPKTRRRSRSYSPASSITELPKSARTISPSESTNEAHIHPLFRSDSPTPPPAASAATMVVAAVGGGQMLSEQRSIRSIQRMRSGSLPSAPQMTHEPSLDDIRKVLEQEEFLKLDLGIDRKMTPPIPDFVLHGGPRSSMHGYNARKKSQRADSGKLSEDGDN